MNKRSFLLILILSLLCGNLEAGKYNQFGVSLYMGSCLGTPVNQIHKEVIGEYVDDPTTFSFGLGFIYHFVPWKYMYIGTNPKYTCNLVSQLEGVYDPHYDVYLHSTYASAYYSETGLFNNVDFNHFFEFPVVLGFFIPINRSQRTSIYIEGGLANGYFTATNKYHIGGTSQIGLNFCFDERRFAPSMQIGLLASYYKDVNVICLGGSMNFLF